MEEKRNRLIQYDFMKSAIKRQMMNCVNKENYRVGIYTVIKTKSAGIVDMIKDIVKELSLEDYLEGNAPFVITPNESRVKFKHGSSIKIVQARKHKKRRINKKWLKRYGYKTILVDAKGWKMHLGTDGSVEFIKDYDKTCL